MEYMLLQIPGIAGETKLEGFNDPADEQGQGMEILSYSWNVSNPVQASPSNVGRTTGRPNFGELVLTKRLDSTSPILADDCASAKNEQKVVFSLVRQDEGRRPRRQGTRRDPVARPITSSSWPGCASWPGLPSPDRARAARPAARPPERR